MDKKLKKTISILCLILGIIMVVIALILDFTKSTNEIRGPLLVVGGVLVLAGLYLLPSKKHKNIINMLFLFPAVFAYLVTVLIPFVFGIFYSLTDWDGIKFNNFVGLDNYVTMFSSPDFVYSFVITFLFTVINMLLVNLVAFGLALLCTSGIKGQNFFRSAYFLPNLIGGIVLGYVWQFAFNKVFTQIVEGSTSWLTDPDMAFFAIVLVSVWQYSGYIMMIYVTGIQGIPKDVIEASSVDGANSFQQVRKIKIPLMRNTVTVCIFLTLVNSFKQFDLNMSLTNGTPTRVIDGALVPSTEFLALNIYKTAIARSDYAMGQTKAVIFFIVLAAISLTQVAINKRKEVEM